MYEKLKDTLHKVMQDSIKNSEVMGVNLLVEKDGKEFLYCEEGLADREAGRKMSRDTIFRLYSQSKTVTAAAAMILMERGELDLYQEVGEILPAFKEMKVEKDGKTEGCDRPILVHDLLRMTSGLVYPEEGKTLAEQASGKAFDEAVDRLHTDKAWTTLEFVNKLAEGPLAFTPGSHWMYGTSADVLGAVIEVVSGKKFSEFLREEIFEPLEMNDTAFWVPQDKQHRLASSYETVVGEDGQKTMDLYTGHYLAIRNDMAEPPAYEAGGAGLVSTLDDFMKFARMLLNKGALNGKQILKPQTVEYMINGELLPGQQRDFETWIGLNGYSYGNLMRSCKNPSQSGMLVREGEYGWDGWLGMYFANFPKENMTILMGTQKKDAGTFALTRKLRNVILSSL